MDTRTMELWFEFGSNYSYLSVMRIEQLAAQQRVTLLWEPFLLGPIFKDFGWETSPFVLQKEKGRYMWKDMARQCLKYGLPWNQPTVFPRRALLPMRVAAIGRREPWIGEFCRQMMHANFALDEELDHESLVRGVLARLGLDASAILAAAVSEQGKEVLRQQTRRARSLGIFGAPTFIVDGDMYWGNDRLEDALQAAARLAIAH